MGEIERRAGAEPPDFWKFIPMAVLLGSGRIFLDVEPWVAVPLSILGALAAFLPFPPGNTTRDIDGWKIHTTEGDKRRALVSVAVPATVMAIDILGGESLLGLPPEWSTVIYGVAFGSAVTYGFSRQAMLPHRRKRELIQQIVENVSLDEVTTSDLEALDQPGARTLARGLIAHGAIDGTRVMARQLARVRDWSVEQVHATARPLDQWGIISRSAIMSGGDPAKVYVELTEKGVVLLRELHQGR